MRSRWAAIVACAGLIVVLTAQTGAFSATQADRSLEIAVADDDAAYLGIETSDLTVPANETSRETLLVLTNRFSVPVSVAATPVDGESTAVAVELPDAPVEIQPGREAPLTATVTCPATATTATVELAVTGRGTDVTVDLTRSVSVTCEATVTESTTTTTATPTATTESI